MQVQNKGSVILAALVAVLVIGAVLYMGIKSANNQTALSVVNPVQEVNPSITPVLQPMVITWGSVDTELQSIDTKMGGLDTYQKNIDNAINDKPIDTGL